MDKKSKPKFRIYKEGMYEGIWSFGICLSHWEDETYVFINLFKIRIYIGWFAI